jgi:CubicO group peptidase (beta-lactamase class C family)
MEHKITGVLESEHVPGLAIGYVFEDQVSWSGGFGWANLEQQVPVTTKTIMNVASVSKPVTATAAMLLWQNGLIDLDRDINDYLSFSVRNPKYPDQAITIRSLLAHRSSIKDGEALRQSYTCGDPTIPLQDWLEGYLVAGGEAYNREENFHSWQPGEEGEVPEEPKAYSNIGYGLLGHIIETVAGLSFENYCVKHIFEPLGMSSTGWRISDIDLAKHATHYTYVQEDSYDLAFLIAKKEGREDQYRNGSYFDHCLYTSPNLPDGGLRTTIEDYGKFLSLYTRADHSQAILQSKTIQEMLNLEPFGQGLCWNYLPPNKRDAMWFHAGFDPGVLAFTCFWPSKNSGVIAMCNAHMKAQELMKIIRSIRNRQEGKQSD